MERKQMIFKIWIEIEPLYYLIDVSKFIWSDYSVCWIINLNSYIK